MSEVYIISAVRTPLVLDASTHYARLSAIELSACALEEVVRRSQAPVESIDDVIWSGGRFAETSPTSIIRLALQQAAVPSHIPAAVVDRHSMASHQALHAAAQAILSGDADLVITGGADTLPLTPPVLDHTGHWLADPRVSLQAQTMAEKWNMTRSALDEYVIMSIDRHSQAHELGYLKDQLIGLHYDNGDTLYNDQHPGEAWRRENLVELPPLLKKSGPVTSAHIPVPAAGAVALMLASPRAVGLYNLNPLASIVSRAVDAADFSLALAGYIPATAKAIKQAGLALTDLDYILVEESSAPAVLAWSERWQVDPTRVNPHGGALAQGQLANAGGALLVTRLIYTLGLHQGHYGLAVSSSPDGMGMATVIERL